MNVEEVLVKGAGELGVQLTSRQVTLFLEYLTKIKCWSEKINITGITDERGIVINHFLDSITPLPFISENSKVLDIGSGGGFPGIPLKIVRPSLEVILLDSIQKKVFFMRDVIRRLGLKEIKAIWGRAEDISNGIPRGYFDFVVSRAVGKIENLLELSIPYLREGGEIILMRGKMGLEEWNRVKVKASRNIRLLKSKKLSLPFGGHQRVILVIKGCFIVASSFSEIVQT
ncbi:MAG: 16S rRNA (guanine(527)-N(7))-methyltransferase RsmG [Thermodesulfobacteriota bacterium]